jgi:HK97 family phage portal protein
MSIFSLFKPKPKPQASAVLEINNSFSSFTGRAFNSPVFRAAVDTVARHCAKLTAHSDDRRLETLLTESPNAYMSSYDMLYRMAAAYFVNNNAFIMIDRDGGHIKSLFPLTPSSVEFNQGADGALYVLMRFADGREAIFPYSDVIHLRRHYFNHELSGADNSPLYGLLDVSDTLQQGVAAATKNAVNLKGVLRFTSLVNPAQLKAEKEQFITDYMGVGNAGGIAATDQRFEFAPVANSPYTVPADTINAVDNAIFRYIGVSPKIVSGEYLEDDFSAFYESLVEPLALQMSLEFSRKTGAGVRFTSERLEFSSAATKIKLLHEAAPLGLMTLNEARRLLALPPVEDGDTRLQSLNYVNSAQADKYQLESEV